MNNQTIHFVHPLPLKASGSGLLTYEIAQRLSTSGHKVHLLTIEESKQSNSKNLWYDSLMLGKTFPFDKVPVYTGIGLPHICFSQMSNSEIQSYINILQKFYKQNLEKQISSQDIVIVSHLWFHSLILKNLGISVNGIFSHGTDLMALSHSPKFAKEVRDAANWADRIIAPSNYIRNKISSLGFKCYEKISCIYPGIDISLFNFNPKQKINHNLLLHIPGKNANFKGTDRLLKAILYSKSQFRNIKLIVIGYGRIKSEVAQMKAKLNKEIKWIDSFIPRTNIAKLLQTASALIIPSRNEPFGMIAAEALACGTPVIGDKSGGLLEIVDQDDGMLVSTENPSELASAILQIINNRDSASNRLKRSKRAHDRFGWPIAVKKWLTWLKDA